MWQTKKIFRKEFEKFHNCHRSRPRHTFNGKQKNSKQSLIKTFPWILKICFVYYQVHFWSLALGLMSADLFLEALHHNVRSCSSRLHHYHQIPPHLLDQKPRQFGPSYLPFRFNWFSTCSRAKIFRMSGFVLERIQISIQILSTKVFGVTRSWKSSASSFTLSSQFESRSTNGESIKKTSKTDQDQLRRNLFSVGRSSVIDIAESVTRLVLVVLAFLLNLPRKETDLAIFNRYSDCLGEYFYTLIRPVLTILTASCGKILSDKRLRKVLRKEIKRFCQANRPYFVDY